MILKHFTRNITFEIKKQQHFLLVITENSLILNFVVKCVYNYVDVF